MNAHPGICGNKPAEQLDLISPAANGGARPIPFEIPPYADHPSFERQPEGYAEQDLFEFEQIAKGRGETFVRPEVPALAARWKWTESEVAEFLERFDARESRQLVPVEQEPEPQSDDDANLIWGIEAQSEIEISRLPGGSVLIHEPAGPGTQAEGERIVITASNVVAFARRVLWAVGFKGVLIASCGNGGGGYIDIDDGDTPERIAAQREEPEFGGRGYGGRG